MTHPRVGQAERLACRERQPTQFRAEARTHCIAREKKSRIVWWNRGRNPAVLPLYGTVCGG